MDNDLDARVRRLEKRTQWLPSRWAGGAAPFKLYQISVITTNNKLLGYASLRGAKWNVLPFGPTPVFHRKLTTAYDPATPVAITDDGIAYGTNISDGSAPCLIINSDVINQAGIDYLSHNPLTFDLPQSCIFLAYRQIQVPVTDPNPLLYPTVTAWEGYWA